MAENLKDLLTILNTTNTQKTDQRLYDFLRRLLIGTHEIGMAVNAISASSSSSGGGGSSIVNNITQQFLSFDGDGGDGGDAIPVPGPSGIAGAVGATGPAGQTSQIVFYEDTISESDSLIPGPIGSTGLTGAQGTPGVTTTIVLSEDSISESESLIPGPPGINGTVGLTGPQGPQGVPLIDTEFPEDPIVIPGSQGIQGIQGLQGNPGQMMFLEPDSPELPDTIQGPPGPVATYIDFTQDLGSGESSGTFDLTGLAGLAIGNDVTLVQTAQAIASKGNARDEFEMDAIQLTGYVLNTTTIRVYWWSPSVVVGIYAFAFAVSPGAISISSFGWTKILPIITTTSSQTTIDFSSIPQTYVALKLLVISQDTAAGTGRSNVRIRLNNDSTAGNYTVTQRHFAQNGVASATTLAASSNGVQIGLHPNAGSASQAGQLEMTILNYTGTIWHKIIQSFTATNDDTVNGTIQTSSARWKSTSPINQITVTTDGTAFLDGSQAILLGLAA